MRRSIATVCVSGGLSEKLEAIAAAGFDAIEIFENDLVCSSLSPREVAEMAGGLGLEIALYQPFRDFEAVPDRMLQRNLDRAARKFDVMEELGAPLMLVCSNVSAVSIDDESRAADQLWRLAELAASRKLRIGYEALAWGRHVRSIDQVRRIVERAAHPHLGVLLDTFHAFANGDAIEAIRSIPGDKIFFVQIADAPRMKLDPLHWSRHYRCFPGQGQLDVTGFVRAVLDAGYAGPLSLEVFNDDFRGVAARQIAQDGMRSLLLLEEEVRKAPAERDGGGRRAGALFDPPAAAQLNGVSFLEFAVDESAGRELGAWLERFGFACAGQHRSKRVALYRAGDVNLVLNAEPDSFAQSYFLFHGVSVCALGVRTANANAAMARAIAFNAPRFEGRVGPNELSIPAVRAPDGGLIYFVDEELESGGLYEIEFMLASSSSHAGTLTGVDHVAMALPMGNLDTWVLYWRAILGLEARDSFVLTDPYGIVRSKAMADARRTLRLPLNISLGRETTAAQTVIRQVGAGVHHIAFGCDDLFSIARDLQSRGAPILEIPSNYYDDLQSRFMLSDAFVDKLRDNHVLYDRAGDGEFLHLYSEFFQGRFFFEFVQRLGAYDDYGAANAPVRMAAHARLSRSLSTA